MPREMNKQNIEIKSNNELSPLNKAFMIVTGMYFIEIFISSW